MHPDPAGQHNQGNGTLASDIFYEAAFNDVGFAASLHPQVSKRAVLFIHGFSGSGYGTWGDFPKYLYERPDIHADIYCYQYCSGIKRITGHGSTVEDYVEQLRAQLVYLASKYSQIYIMAHSMGGLLAKWAVMSYLNLTEVSGGRTAIAGVFLIASASYGSPLATFPLGYWRKDRRVLRPASAAQATIQTWFDTRVDAENRVSAGDARKYIIPIYSLRATRDRVVRTGSSTMGVPAPNQLTPINGTHGSLKLPNKPTSWVVETIAERIHAIEETRSVPSSTRPYRNQGTTTPRGRAPIGVVQAQFRTTNLSGIWMHAYVQAMLGAQGALPIVDKASISAGHVALAELRLVATDSHRAMTRDIVEHAHVSWAVDSAQQDPANVSAIAIVGHESTAAAGLIQTEWLPQPVPHSNIWTESVADDASLQSVLERWISYAVELISLRTDLRHGVSNYQRIGED